MRRLRKGITWLLVALMTISLIPTLAAAQEGQPPADSPTLTLYSDYPSLVVGMDENVTITLKLRAEAQPQVAHLEISDLPEGWTATFKGGGRTIKAVYVTPDDDAAVSLRLEPPADVTPGTYRFVVTARSDAAEAEWPLELTVKEKVPPRLAFDVDLPIVTGSPDTTFRFSVTLKNEGDEDLLVNLLADAPSGFGVDFRVAGKKVTSFPLEANQSKHLTVEVHPYGDPQAGDYPITIRAQGGDVEASVSLTAKVTGKPDLRVTAPNGRLSAEANAGKEASVKVIVVNDGTAPAHDVELSASEPADWSVEFDPKKIAEIPPGQQVEVTAKVRPSDKAVAGDYMVTMRAQAEGTGLESADFRITVRTSTLWGVVGLALIAVAVGVVALAVMRFGRR